MNLSNKDSGPSPNPYESPTALGPTASQDESSLQERLAQYRKRRRRWSFECWAIGLALFVLGGVLLQVSQKLQEIGWAKHYTLTFNAIACLLIIAAIFTIVLGPISWFWLQKRR